jgi:hypothetical protein
LRFRRSFSRWTPTIDSPDGALDATFSVDNEISSLPPKSLQANDDLDAGVITTCVAVVKRRTLLHWHLRQEARDAKNTGPRGCGIGFPWGCGK